MELGSAGRPDRRTVNDDRRRIFDRGERPIAFVCECGGADCGSSVVLTPAEYDARAATGPVVAHDWRPIAS